MGDGAAPVENRYSEGTSGPKPHQINLNPLSHSHWLFFTPVCSFVVDPLNLQECIGFCADITMLGHLGRLQARVRTHL